MSKSSGKSRPAQQNAYIVAPGKKPQKPAKNAGLHELPAAAKRPKKRRARKMPVCLTIPERIRFFKAITSIRDRGIFSLAYFHGLRASEIGKLQFSDYRPGSSLNLDRIRLTRLKGSISGECPVVPECARAIRAWIRKRGHLEGVLFPSRQRSPISRFRIFALMQRSGAAAGIPREKWHPHCLRHSTAVHLLADRKEGLVDVQRHLGHADVRSTMVYLGALSDEFNEARARRLSTWR